MNREILATPKFLRDSRRWAKSHPQTAADVQTALAGLAADAFDPVLRAHKLKGGMSGYWACSAGYDIRIVFEFVPCKGAEAIQLVTMGTHDEVY